MRKNISLNMSLMDLLVLMSEGNPGAATTLCDLWAKYQDSDAFMLVLFLDDMNIRGTQIWIGFKYYCNQDLDVFAQAIRDRDQGMIDCINEEGRNGNHTEVAVKNGGSYR
jgi:hypothetical protein